MKDEAPRLAIKLNNCATNDPCAICGDRTEPEVGPELFVEGTWALVCYECGDKYAPDLVSTLRQHRRREWEEYVQAMSEDMDEAEKAHQARIQHVLDKLGIQLSEKATQILWGHTFYGTPPVFGDGDLSQMEWDALQMVRGALLYSDDNEGGYWNEEGYWVFRRQEPQEPATPQNLPF